MTGGAPTAAFAGLGEIVETKTTLGGARKQFRCRVVSRAPDAAVVLFISDRAYQVGDLELPVGTVTLGYFWTDRPFNVYHWLTPEGRTIAHYFNLSANTSITDDALQWSDLTVDVLVRPGGSPEVLDEDELPDDLAPALVDVIAAARAVTLRDAIGTAALTERESTRLWQDLFGRPRP